MDNFVIEGNNNAPNQNNNQNGNNNNQSQDIFVNIRRDRDFFIPVAAMSSDFGIDSPYYSFGSVDPLKESFFHILQALIFPNLTPWQLSSIICYLIVIVFIALLCFGIDNTNNNQFLPIKFSVIDRIGGFYPYEMKKNILEYYRIFTFHFIHFNFSHLVYNILSLITFCSLFEVLVKKYIYLLVFFLSAIFGNFSAGCFFNENERSCGANAGIAGLLGGFCSLFIINWRELIPIFGEFGRFIAIYLVSVFMFLSVCYYHFNEYANILVQFFSAVYGGLIFAAITNPINPARVGKVYRFVCTLLIILSVTVSLIGFILKK